MNATTGETSNVAATATQVLTLALPKTGLQGVSELLLADIGIPRGVYRRLGLSYDPPFDGADRVHVRAVD
ncbi:hypothetical protein [Halogeometricum borinquense]|uniref:YjeF N-terminal domain-containing protein n=1 Tax=Halogeometricum borinquense (strain ATCC 700274 / DSM 11551 / JCM 10706 / KCTC 4070 / PR3) TaxID=469382 RepID=E4NRM7_HALBP|nr:hypothetical protein [Halogeometricum borinquense]ADQ65703.1 hypothetical protein Hbor_00910 [Halogeometricum borinquense DSM 11551]